jgi:hypothetical protein
MAKMKSAKRHETTLNELGEMLTHVVKHMATKDDIANMATKEDIAGIRSELRDIKALTEIESAIEDHAGHSKEIDHALERIAAIERHLGIKHPAH